MSIHLKSLQLRIAPQRTSYRRVYGKLRDAYVEFDPVYDILAYLINNKIGTKINKKILKSENIIL
jgi:hypothetical protein